MQRLQKNLQERVSERCYQLGVYLLRLARLRLFPQIILKMNDHLRVITLLSILLTPPENYELAIVFQGMRYDIMSQHIIA